MNREPFIIIQEELAACPYCGIHYTGPGACPGCGGAEDEQTDEDYL